MTVLLTRWFRQHARESKTLQRQVWLLLTSKETEIKLTNIARASLEELMIDYQDFLRINKLLLWDKNHRLVEGFVN